MSKPILVVYSFVGPDHESTYRLIKRLSADFGNVELAPLQSIVNDLSGRRFDCVSIVGVGDVWPALTHKGLRVYPFPGPTKCARDGEVFEMNAYKRCKKWVEAFQLERGLYGR